MIARVRAVIAASSNRQFIRYVSGSMSTKTGFAPTNAIASAVAIKVFDTVITSSPGPILQARSAKARASVPDELPTPYWHPQYEANECSNACNCGPRKRCMLSRTSSNAAIISGLSAIYCARKSTRGTLNDDATLHSF